jgi:serine protease Do
VDSALLDGRNVRAYLHDGAERRLEAVRTDRNLQLALLRIASDDEADTNDFPYFELASAPEPRRGQWVWAGGNPFKVASGAEPISFARGVLSGATRLDGIRGTADFPYRGDVLVIDAITSTPGYAGGPLVDADGRLLGMIGRMVESRMTHTMVNYAVPVGVLADFIATATSPADSAAAAMQAASPGYHGIKFFELGYRANPVYVERVRRGSPAARAGLRKDDLIIGANGQPVPNLAALERILSDLPAGDALELTVMRDKDIHKFTIVLEEAP